MFLPTRLVVCPDDTKASVFASSPRVRLKGARVETGNFAEIGFQLLLSSVNQLVVDFYVQHAQR